MDKKRKRSRRKRTGIFIYCTEELKNRIDRARRFTSRTISGYVMNAVLPRLEADEVEMKRRQL
jgi:hypothetical protein